MQQRNSHPPDVQFLHRVDYETTYAAMQRFTQARVAQMAFDSDFQSENDVISLPNMRDQLWICEHLPVFTQGLAGKSEHLLLPGDIPVVHTNRGGQVTYHGPGQIVAYPLLDLKKAGYFVKEYVFRLEEAVLKTLLHFGITGHRVRGAPGIYVRTDDPASHARLELTEADLRPVELQPSKQLGSDPIYLEPEIKWGQTPFNSAPQHIGKIAALGIKLSRHFTYHGVALNVAMDLEPFSRINPCGYAGLRTVDMATLGVSASFDDVAQVFAAKLCAYLAP